MSVIYEALKKAGQEAKEALPANRQWCPEFIFVTQDPHRYGWLWCKGRLKWLGLSAVLVALGAAATFYFAPSMRVWLARISLLSAYVEPKQESLDALKRRAQESYVHADFAEAVRAWEEILARSVPDALLYNHLGLAHKKLGNLDKAEAYDLEALALDPNNAETMNNLGVVYFEEGRTDDARAMLEKALQTNPNYVDPYFQLGRLYEKENRLADAIRAYTVFLERYLANGPIKEKVKARIEALEKL